MELNEATKHLEAPIYIGVMPLDSTQNAEFLHNEVPGIKLTDEIRQEWLNRLGNREEAGREGLAIAKELIDTAMEHFHGIYLITPFIRYDLTVNYRLYSQKNRLTHKRDDPNNLYM